MSSDGHAVSSAFFTAMLAVLSVAALRCSSNTTPPASDVQTTCSDRAQLDAPTSDRRKADGRSIDRRTDVPERDARPQDAQSPDKGFVAGTWVTVPGGTFTMGSPSSELCREANEDQHQVTLTHSFEILTTEVTQAQYESIRGFNPSVFKSCGPGCPVESMSWDDAADYCNGLSTKKGLATCYSCYGVVNHTCSVVSAYAGKNIYSCPGYRLPTEAEWEYVYRAGTTTAFYNGVISSCVQDVNADKIGWYYGLYPSSWGPHPSAQKQMNAWGLYDMAGNVWEWCHDSYQENLGVSPVTDPVTTGDTVHVLRGGDWHTQNAYLVRAAVRYVNSPSSSAVSHVGFRCVRTL